MKKIINIVLIAFFMTSSFYACEDALEAPAKSTLEPSVIFSNFGLARETVVGIIEPMFETNSYRGRFIPWYGMNTDAEWHNNSPSTDDNLDLVKYSAQPSNDQMNTSNNAWSQMNLGIERANLAIRGLREFGDIESNEDMAYLLGVALTYRAVYYSDLVKAWGDVPASFEPVTDETLFLPRSSRDDIYKQLLSDLEEAATYVPWPGQSLTGTVEDVNKAFVKGLRARIALAAGGYSQYADGVRLSDDPELARADMYAIALKECQDIINSGTVRLEPSYEQFWRDFNDEENKSAGGESLWEIPFSDARGRVLFTFAVEHQSVDKYTGQARGGVAGPLPYMFYDYEAADTRRDVTCVPYEWADVSPSTTIAMQSPLPIDTWMFGKYRYEWKSRRVTASNDDGQNWIYMRYAEVLLMAAEAALETGDEGSAKNYLAQIRKRAFEPEDWPVHVDNYLNPLSGQALFDAIVEEHKLEMCGEMQRKQALIRWNLLKTKLDEAKAKMYDLRSRSGAYSDVPETLYYRLAEDNETLEFYGLERGETEDRSGEYSDQQDWAVPEALENEKIESVYVGDPNANQFWPIWQVFLDGSNGQLTNDLLN